MSHENTKTSELLRLCFTLDRGSFRHSLGLSAAGKGTSGELALSPKPHLCSSIFVPEDNNCRTLPKQVAGVM